jgi:hypothetical protein
MWEGLIMFFSRDRYLFSKLTTEECQELIKCHGTDLSRYTIGQIQEMIPKTTENGITSTMVVISSEEKIINTGISVEEYIKWQNR